jgi:hypothetical protein
MDALPGIENFLLFLVTESLVLDEIIRVFRHDMTGKVLLAKRRILVFGVAGPMCSQPSSSVAPKRPSRL